MAHLTGAGGDQPHTYSPDIYHRHFWRGHLVRQLSRHVKLRHHRCQSVGDIGITSLSYAFYGDTNLTSLPTTLPSGVTDLSHTLDGATSFNQNVSSWDTAASRT